MIYRKYKIEDIKESGIYWIKEYGDWLVRDVDVTRNHTYVYTVDTEHLQAKCDRLNNTKDCSNYYYGPIPEPED